ncbi:hypothetical protein KIPB_004181 [Kipferlia bialata]|uniref:Uncharacterized protein n=1 Tax=Kipferlia bialata TaxID=797122 RepID=A0A9K3GH85_9EUKA|nr:hypothetical protein KIPB_004181 [Kipferlia bialata]|eukprot:g4181.t1
MGGSDRKHGCGHGQKNKPNRGKGGGKGTGKSGRDASGNKKATKGGGNGVIYTRPMLNGTEDITVSGPLQDRCRDALAECQWADRLKGRMRYQPNDKSGPCPWILSNDLAALGFDRSSVSRVVATLFDDLDIYTKAPLPENPTIQCRQRTAEGLDICLTHLIMATGRDRLPRPLGGKAEWTQPVHGQGPQETAALPNQRKPKAHRKAAVADVVVTKESAVIGREARSASLAFLIKTGHVQSDPEAAKVIDMHSGSVARAYLSLLSEQMPYKKGNVGGRQESDINGLRRQEESILSSALPEGVHFKSIAAPTSLVEYIDQVWVLAARLERLPLMPAVKISAYLQKATHFKQFNERLPLITVQGRGGAMLQPHRRFGGAYPNSPCYLDIKSPELSIHGRRFLMNTLYHVVNRACPSGQPMFMVALHLGSEDLLRDMKREELRLHKQGKSMYTDESQAQLPKPWKMDRGAAARAAMPTNTAESMSSSLMRYLPSGEGVGYLKLPTVFTPAQTSLVRYACRYRSVDINSMHE